jgi:hypothetical protein
MSLAIIGHLFENNNRFLLIGVTNVTIVVYAVIVKVVNLLIDHCLDNDIVMPEATTFRVRLFWGHFGKPPRHQFTSVRPRPNQNKMAPSSRLSHSLSDRPIKALEKSASFSSHRFS